MIKLSLLIPTMPTRHSMFTNLVNELNRQIDDEGVGKEVEIISDPSGRSIGAKRNSLLQTAFGEYVCFIDDDDWVSPNYVKLLMDGIETKPDCCSLAGIITWDGKNPEIFEHSLKYDVWATQPDAPCKYEEHSVKYTNWRLENNITFIDGKPVKYLRNPNHLNCIKSEIAKQFTFPETNFGEDHDFSKQLHASGLIKTEYWIEPILYHYRYITKK